MFPRFAREPLKEALDDSPVVVVHGPRQCGKSTLATSVGDELGYTYFTFDDDVTRDAATQDPLGFVDDLPERAILDEVQRVPQIFTSVKRAVDRRRTPGRFLLTGSTNVLLLPTLADSLAGRMSILRLHPLAQCEIESSEPDFLERLFAGDFPIAQSARLGRDLMRRIVEGGYPAALARSSDRRRSSWYRDYVDAIVQRDVRDLARIGSADVLPRLLTVAASQTARLLNVSDLAAPFQLSRPTIGTYVTLLRQLFLVEELPPWHVNRLSRVVKAPKLHVGDTGIAVALLGVTVETLAEDRQLLGQLVETFVVQEVARQASWSEHNLRLHHFRTRDAVEVDLVLERDARNLAAIEVKAGATVTEGDFRGLRKLRDDSGDRFRAGVVLYDGETTVGFGDRLFAVPIRRLWETRR